MYDVLFESACCREPVTRLMCAMACREFVIFSCVKKEHKAEARVGRSFIVSKYSSVGVCGVVVIYYRLNNSRLQPNKYE